MFVNTGKRSKLEKIDNNKVNTTVRPLSYQTNLYTRPTSNKSQGGLDPRFPPPPSGSALAGLERRFKKIL